MDIMMQKLTKLDIASLILAIIGGLNWLLVGVFGFDLVAAIFGQLSFFSRFIYIVIGLAALYLAVNIQKFNRQAISRPS